MSLPVRVLSVFSLLAAALPCAADPEASARHAAEAVALLERGERMAAVAEALKGLPEDVSDADLGAYAPAYTSLLRAAGARTPRLDRFGPQYFAVNATGDRAVIGGTITRQSTPALGASPSLADIRAIAAAGSAAASTIDPYALIDPRDGTVIAEIAPASMLLSSDLGWGPSEAPAFSPDGGMVALWAMDEGEVRRFDARDGAPLPPLTALAGRVPGHVVGFSPDGTRLAAEARDHVVVWDTASDEVVMRYDLDAAAAALAWSPAGDLIAVVAPRAGEYGFGPFTFLRLRPDGVEEIAHLPGRAEGWLGLRISPFGPEAIVELGEAAVVMNLETGEPLARFDEVYADTFLRNGTALGGLVLGHSFLTFLPAPGHDLLVVSLDGQPLAPEARDWLPLEHLVFDIDGNRLDRLGPPRPYAYRGDDLPAGAALIDHAMGLLDPAARSEVAAERVAR